MQGPQLAVISDTSGHLSVIIAAQCMTLFHAQSRNICYSNAVTTQPSHMIGPISGKFRVWPKGERNFITPTSLSLSVCRSPFHAVGGSLHMSVFKNIRRKAELLAKATLQQPGWRTGETSISIFPLYSASRMQGPQFFSNES